MERVPIDLDRHPVLGPVDVDREVADPDVDLEGGQIRLAKVPQEQFLGRRSGDRGRALRVDQSSEQRGPGR
jgi:hypothetical protein